MYRDMKQRIALAKVEARRFVKIADEALARADREKMDIAGTKESGSVRRASLDLTRALAEMRKFY